MFIVIVALTVSGPLCDVIVDFGNPLIPSTDGLDTAGRVVLFLEPVTFTGILTSVDIYFRNAQPATFQVWRPVDPNTNSFMLVSQITVSSYMLQAQTVRSSPCSH